MSSVPTPAGIARDFESALPAAPARRSFMRFIVDRNPFFLLSAVCMFAGVRIILSALNVSPGDLPRLLLLIFALNVYEASVIALALFLILRRGQLRDGWMLLSIEALFLVDLTDLNAELFTANLRWGIAINLACWGLSVVKVTVVLRALKLRLTTPEFAYVAAQLAGVFFLAGIFKQVARHGSHEGSLSALNLYAAWWIVGGAVAAAALVLGKPSERPHAAPMSALPGRLYIFLPFISLLVHLCGANRVYAITFQPANIAPVLLGAAILLTRWRPMMSRRFLIGLQAVLAGVAILLSTPLPADLLLHVGSHEFSPLRLALTASAGVLACGFFQSWHLLAAQMAAMAVVAAMLGNTPGDMARNSLALARALLAAMKRLVPETPMQWGVVAVAGSFLMLAAGAVVSLRKQSPATHEPLAGPPPVA